MKVKLYEIIVTNKEKVLKFNKKPLFGGLINLYDNEYETYRYWIEFRVDECRFWYGETKPVKVDENSYEFKTSYLMTKNGCEKSVDIILGIENRIKEVFNVMTKRELCKYNIESHYLTNWRDFKVFDKPNNDKSIKEDLQSKSIFLKK